MLFLYYFCYSLLSISNKAPVAVKKHPRTGTCVRIPLEVQTFGKKTLRGFEF